MRRPARALAAVVLLALTAACTAGAGTDDGDPAPTASADPGPQAEDVVATAVVPMGGIDVEVTVHPLVRAGEHVVLTLDWAPADPWDPEVDHVFLNMDSRVTSFIHDGSDPVGIRLFDLRNDVAYHVGRDADDDPVVAPARWHVLESDEGTRLQMPFAAPPADVDDVSLFLPGAPLVAELPIIDDDVPSTAWRGGAAADDDADEDAAGDDATPSDGPTATEPPEVLDLEAIVEAPTYPLESTSTELRGAVQTVESTERVELALEADVLFAFDSADLTDEAAAVVDLAAQRLQAREPGDGVVVGHTDDQGEPDYNQDLSERRAQAVADALAEHLDPDDYPTQVEGRGETDPVAEGSDEESRALNRRVEITLVSTVVTRTELSATGELPPWEEEVGTAGTPLVIENFARRWLVDATAREVHGHVVVDLSVHADDDESGLGWAVNFLRGRSTHRGPDTIAPHDMTARATVLQGATRLYPMDYMVGTSDTWPGGEWFTASDLDSNGWIDGGQTRIYSFVYPRLDVDTVHLQVGNGVENDFRLLDIPVERAG